MFSLGSGRHNQNVLKVLVLLSFLLLILLCYQHHSNQKTQLQLQKDIAISKQRTKQVEYELDAIQKGLQLDLNKERTEHKKTKTELAEARNSMEVVAASQRTKEQSLEEYYGKLQECQKQNADLEKECEAETDRINIQLNDCLGTKMALERNENEHAIQESKNSNEVIQFKAYIQQLQAQIQERDNEINKYRNHIHNMQQQQQQGMNNMGQAQQHQMGQNNVGGGNADLGGMNGVPKNLPFNNPQGFVQAQHLQGAMNNNQYNNPNQFNNQLPVVNNNQMPVNNIPQSANNNLAQGMQQLQNNNMVQPQGQNQNVLGARPEILPSNVGGNNAENQPQYAAQGQKILAQNGDVIRQPELEHKPNADQSEGDDAGNQAAVNQNDSSGNEESPINWRSQNNKADVPESNNHAGPEAPDGLVQVADSNNDYEPEESPPLQGAPPMQAPEGQLKPPSGAESGKNLAEVDVVAGDGQGALLPPMGDSERQAMEDRIEQAREEEQSNAEVKREFKKDDESVVDAEEETENESEDNLDRESEQDETENDAAANDPNFKDPESEDQIERELSGEDGNKDQSEDADSDQDEGSESKDESLNNDYEDEKEGWADPRSQKVQKLENGVDAPANNKVHDFNDGSELKESLPDFEQN